MGFATEYFPDQMAFIDDGITVHAITTATTTSGSPIQMGGSAPFRKLEFILQMGSGSTSAGSVTLAVYTATASGGAYASFTTVASAVACSQSVNASAAGKWFLVTELRGECLTDLGTNGYFVKPVITTSAVVCPTSLTTLGFVSGSLPASAFNSSTLGGFSFLALM
jgi:hypothetical protein